MKIYLAGGHICGKYQQIKDYESLLSRSKQCPPNNPIRAWGGYSKCGFLAGGVSGNLKPAWQKVARQPDASLLRLSEELENEGFSCRDKRAETYSTKNSRGGYL